MAAPAVPECRKPSRGRGIFRIFGHFSRISGAEIHRTRQRRRLERAPALSRRRSAVAAGASGRPGLHLAHLAGRAGRLGSSAHPSAPSNWGSMAPRRRGGAAPHASRGAVLDPLRLYPLNGRTRRGCTDPPGPSEVWRRLPPGTAASGTEGRGKSLGRWAGLGTTRGHSPRGLAHRGEIRQARRECGRAAHSACLTCGPAVYFGHAKRSLHPHIRASGEGGRAG